MSLQFLCTSYALSLQQLTVLSTIPHTIYFHTYTIRSGVKEASERAIINLRSLQTQYVAAVRRAGAATPSSQSSDNSNNSSSVEQHPTTSLFQSQDVLRPFLLATNYSNASYNLVLIAIESIQLLLKGDAICNEDYIQISRVLVIQGWCCADTLGLGAGQSVSSGGGSSGNSGEKGNAPPTSGNSGGGGGSLVSSTLGGITGMVMGSSSTNNASDSANKHTHYTSNRTLKEDTSISLKILQTITMLIDSKSIQLSSDIFGACLNVCLLLGAGQTYSDSQHGSGIGGGGGIRERFRSEAVNAHHQHVGTKEDTSGGGTAGNVKRAALATMNQILSILFDRAKDVMLTSVDSSTGSSSRSEHDESLLTLAEETMNDLCKLVTKSSASTKSNSQTQQAMTKLNGPFAASTKDGLSPSPTTSLSLVDMIMKQICVDLFTVCFDAYGNNSSSNNGDEIQQKQTDDKAGVRFATKVITQVFQLGQSLLGSQYCYHVTKLSLESSLSSSLVLKDVPPKQLSSLSDLIDFCLYYYTTSLVTTLLTNYLSSTSISFYGSFDTNNYVTSDQVSSISKMAIDMMKQLVSFVSEATEAYHKSDDFEDGYIFSQSERESFDIGITTSSSARGSTAAAQHGGGNQDPLLPVSSISNEKIWRAFLALEVLTTVVTSHLEQLSWIDSNTVSLIAVAASDFATISASNRERILLLLLVAHSADEQSLPSSPHATFKPSSTSNTTESSGDKGRVTPINDNNPTSSDAENSNTASAIAAKVTDALVVDSIELPQCDAGATTWLAFKCIIFLVKSLKDLAISVEAKKGDLESSRALSDLVNGSFAPSVSMLQHFIRRMLGSPIIVSQTLSSYEELACASMTVDSQSTNVRRQAILTSLCKLCLPSWGKRRPNCQLKESNIDSLWTMLWIIHSNFEKISEEWDVILSTLDQLAIVQISSSKLDEAYCEKAATISGCFIRLSSFTTCFTGDALLQFISSLIKLSEVVSFEPLLDQNITRESSELSAVSDSPEKAPRPAGREPSISGKILGFAGRAFGGGSTTAAPQPSPLASTNNPSFRRVSVGGGTSNKTYAEDLRETTCSQMAKMKISTSSTVIRKIPLPLLLLVIVAEANSYRLSTVEETVAKHLCDIVAKSASVELRSFAMEVLIHFMPVSLTKSDMASKYGSGPLMVPDNEDMNEFPLEVHPAIEDSNNNVQETSPSSEPQLLKILCQTIQLSTQVETAENCLNALLVVLEGAGHSLSGDNLITVINTLSVLSGHDVSNEEDEPVIDRSSRQWVNVSSLAFQNLKLILDEFLEPASASEDSDESPLNSIQARDAILDCCVTFGRSRHDVNTSLTATGMLWSLADRDSSPDTLEVVLLKLASLAMDDRPELRNCSVNTLFSCVVGLGEQFTDEQWKTCLDETIFGIMTGITSAINDAENKEASGSSTEERYKVAVHHSRNSARKQWATTQILVLRGLERVLRIFFSRLLETLLDTTQDQWFLITWTKILQVSFDCAIIVGERETLDMRLAGVELIVLCAQLSSKAGIVAAGNSARVGTNMEVVGGALRSVRDAVEDRSQVVERTSIGNEEELDSYRQELFDISFYKLAEFRVYLDKNGKEENQEAKGHLMLDSLLTQVLTKLVGELSKLYECCKNNEMLPGQCELELDISIENNGGYESQFLHFLLVIASNAGNDTNSRYLNQVQRGVMSLLQSMAANSSLRAFQTLAAISGDHMFV